MAEQDKYPRNVGRQIPFEQAKDEMTAWENAHRGRTGKVRVSPKIIGQALSDESIHGIRFCCGYDESYNFVLVMAGITGQGKAVITMNTNGPITIDEYKACRERWAEARKSDLNYVYMGSDVLSKIASSNANYVTLAFIIDQDNNQNFAILDGGEGGQEEADDDQTAYNASWPCPPFCPNGE